MKNNLPAGWAIVKIGDILNFSGGGTPSKHIAKFWNGDIPWASVKDVKGKYLTKTQDTITKEGLDASATQLAEAGSVLLVTRMAPGRPIITQVQTAINQDLKIVRPRFPIPPLFIYYAFLNYERKFLEIASGTTVQGIRVEDIKELEILFPPLTEQNRIVAQLEATMQKLEASQERLEKIPVLLKKFRKSVLSAAVSGRLTEAWRKENTGGESAADVLKRVEEAIDEKYREQCIIAIADGKRKPKDHRKNKKSIQLDGDLAPIPSSWAYARLEDLTYQITDGAHHTPTYVDSGVKFLSVKNIRPFAIDASQTRFISAKQHAELSTRCNPEPGDILYTKIGSVGYAAINNLDEEFSLFVSVGLIKPVKEHLSNRYLEIALNAETTLNQAKSRVKGIGTPDLHLVEIRDFKIGVPPFAEQVEIIRQVNHYFELADQLEARFEQAAALVEQLPQALLAKAFSGHLVPQDPNDEPASVLLERLATGAPAPAKGKRGRTAKRKADAPLFE